MFLEMLKCPLPPQQNRHPFVVPVPHGFVAEPQVAPPADASTGAAEGGAMILMSDGVIRVRRLLITTHS